MIRSGVRRPVCRTGRYEIKVLPDDLGGETDDARDNIGIIELRCKESDGFKSRM